MHQSLAAGLLLQAYASQVTEQWSTQDDEKKELQNSKLVNARKQKKNNIVSYRESPKYNKEIDNPQ